jgi:D-amino-acid dehydrogenase
MARPDVLVVGGGAIGVCAALEAARRGASVTLLERGLTLASGCSAGNAGLICPSHAAPLATPRALRQGLRWMWKPESPFYLRLRPEVLPWIARFAMACRPDRARISTELLAGLCNASLALHTELVRAGIDTGLAQDGVLSVFRSSHAFSEMCREAQEVQFFGVEFEMLTKQEALKLEPNLAGEIAGAIYYPDDAHCDPLRFVESIGRAAREIGVDIRTGVEVLELHRRRARVETIRTTVGDLPVGELVIAAGAWTPGLARASGFSVPVEGGKGYHVDLERGAGDPRLPVWLPEDRVIVTPLPRSIRLAGTLELAGLDFSVNSRRLRAVLQAGRRGVNGLDSRRIVQIWRGIRPCSPDGLPIVGRVDGLKNLILATGHGMMGLTLAPITGCFVGEILAGEPPSHNLLPLRPDRFKLTTWLRSEQRREPHRRVDSPQGRAEADLSPPTGRALGPPD